MRCDNDDDWWEDEDEDEEWDDDMISPDDIVDVAYVAMLDYADSILACPAFINFHVQHWFITRGYKLSWDTAHYDWPWPTIAELTDASIVVV